MNLQDAKRNGVLRTPCITICLKMLQSKVLLLRAMVFQAFWRKRRELAPTTQSRRDAVTHAAHATHSQHHTIIMSEGTQPKQPTRMSWQYAGEDASSEAIDNVQICDVGSTLKHDVFGACTLLDSLDAAPGSLRVRIHSEDRVCEVTEGHLHVLAPSTDSSNGDTADCKKDAPKPDNSANSNNNNEAGAGTGNNTVDNKSEETNRGASNETRPSPDDKTPQDLPAPCGEEDEDSDKAAQELFQKVISSMSEQTAEFILDVTEGRTELVFYRSLVLIDTPAVLTKAAAEGGTPILQIGQAVRDRSTGNFVNVCRIFKPLLGYIVSKETGLAVDEEGEHHTMALASGSRMLGGNSRCFPKERDSLIICMECKRLGYVWLGVRASQLHATFDVEPSPEDVDTAWDVKNESERKAFSAKSCELWTSMNIVKVTPEEVPGGGIGVQEGLLKTTENMRLSFKRRQATNYLTTAEQEKVDEERARQQKLEAERRASAGGRAGRGRARGAGGRGRGRQSGKRARPQRVHVLSDDEGGGGEDEEESETESLGSRARRSGLRARPPQAAPAAAPATAPAAAAPRAARPVAQPTRRTPIHEIGTIGCGAGATGITYGAKQNAHASAHQNHCAQYPSQELQSYQQPSPFAATRNVHYQNDENAGANNVPNNLLSAATRQCVVPPDVLHPASPMHQLPPPFNPRQQPLPQNHQQHLPPNQQQQQQAPPPHHQQQQYPPPNQQQYPPLNLQQYPPPKQQQYPPPNQQQNPLPNQPQYPPPNEQQCQQQPNQQQLPATYPHQQQPNAFLQQAPQQVTSPFPQLMMAPQLQNMPLVMQGQQNYGCVGVYSCNPQVGTSMQPTGFLAAAQQRPQQPSLAAIQARIQWNKKKEADLIESQALYEYYQQLELYGMRQ